MTAITCSACARSFVGMAGAVYGYYLTFIDPRGMFSILLSVQLILSMLMIHVLARQHRVG